MSSRRAIPLLFFVLCALVAPAAVRAAELVNINTADSAALQTLTGIGPSKAQAIIDYRTQQGPFATIEDIMDVSGIGTATFNGIKDFITVGATQTPQTQTQTQTQATTSAPISTAAAVVPEISARISGAGAVSAGAGSFLVGEAFSASGQPLMSGVRYLWNFGDGSTAEGRSVFHTYMYPGTYHVVLTVAYNYSSAMVRSTIEASPARTELVLQNDGSVVVVNRGASELNVGGWSLRDNEKLFVIPADTYIAPSGGIRFAQALLQFSGSVSTALYYPNGAPAAPSTPAADSPLRGQPISAAEVSKLKQPAGVSVQSAVAEEVAPESGPMVLGVTTAADPKQGGNTALWVSLAGLAGVLAAGVGVARYLQPKKEETSLTADEFDIEG